MKTKGLTAIEILISVIIIGVFAALIVPRYIDLGQSAKLAAIKSILSNQSLMEYEKVVTKKEI